MLFFYFQAHEASPYCLLDLSPMGKVWLDLWSCLLIPIYLAIAMAVQYARTRVGSGEANFNRTPWVRAFMLAYLSLIIPVNHWVKLVVDDLVADWVARE